MKKTKYDISVIIPVYNTEAWVEDTIKCLINQKYDFSKIQVILINDGSPDNSDAIIQPYAKKYDNILYINKKNEGVSKTRNLGLSLSEGRYILFLDSDDTISNDTIASIVPFFDEHYDEIDLVSYRLIPIKNGRQLKEHYRQRYLTTTGVYDLTKREYWFASVTTMNYCIKNKFDKNVQFDETLEQHEDQKFSMEIIKDKMKIGFVEDGIYWYLRQPQSATNTKFYAYYLFENTISFWEDFFKDFKGDIPEYFQALFINDINWKNLSGILMPYQFEGKEFEKAIGRIKALLQKVNDQVILRHPGVSFYHKYYWIDFKDNRPDKKVEISGESVVIKKDGELIYGNNKITLDLIRFKVVDNIVKMLICIKSPAFLYDDEKPRLMAAYDNEDIKKEFFDVRDSSYGYVGCKEKIARFYDAEIEIDYTDLKMVKFFVIYHGEKIIGEMKFPLSTVFSDRLERYEYVYKKKMFKFNVAKNTFLISDTRGIERFEYKLKKFMYYLVRDKKRFIIRTLASIFHKRREIWLYYDCKGVKKDNGYYQFIHDLPKRDGVKRYYVTANDRKFNKGLFKGKARFRLIKFESLRHKLMYLSADKIITAFVENENCNPYTNHSYANYVDLSKIPEVIYLQHGILHAHTPWKYSFDRLDIEKEVISTYFEKENFVKNYGFTEEHLIDCGMPRYDFLTRDVKKTNTILYAPSWRSYLVGKQFSGYAALDKEFEESEFYIESKKFLESKELNDMLEKYDFVLNFKLHPIFKKYEHFYNIKSDRIKIGADLPESEYKVFITDFSSYVFDFVYLKDAIIYFVPDLIKFKSGMNLYRELDFKFDNGIGDFCTEGDKALKLLENVLKNNGEPSKDKKEKLDKFFIHDDHNQRDRLYEALIKDRKKK